MVNKVGILQQTELTAINTLTGTFSNAANTRFALRQFHFKN